MTPTPMFTVTVMLLMTACGVNPVLTPRLEDAQAPGDAYRQLQRKPSACEHEVEIFVANTRLANSYDEVADLSATCSPGAASVCEDTLRERACKLGADAVLLASGSGGAGVPPGASGQSLISRGGKAIRWRQ